jgi:ADP-ribose pyrophosphatase
MQTDMIQKKLRPWKTIKKETILDHNHFLLVENHVVELPDGNIISDWSWVKMPDAVIILAVTKEQQFVCFRQTRYAVAGTTLATAGGMIEENELPLDAAKRELLEETGYTSEQWVNLGSYVLDPNRGMATMHLYLALDARYEREPFADDLEDQELLFLSKTEIEEALLAGEFKVLTSAAVVSLSLNYINSRHQ